MNTRLLSSSSRSQKATTEQCLDQAHGTRGRWAACLAYLDPDYWDKMVMIRTPTSSPVTVYLQGLGVYTQVTYLFIIHATYYLLTKGMEASGFIIHTM